MNRPSSVCVSIFAFINLARVGAAESKNITGIPLAKPAAHESGPMFTRLVDKAQTGIDFVSPVDLEH